jgi:methylated-DNA-[protein]-cysteine S-methyltransferase
MYASTLDTAAGPFTIVAADDAILASGWTADPATLLNLIHPSIRPSSVSERSDLGPFTRAVAAYHAGDFDAIVDVPVRQISGDFLVQAWKALRDVPAGKPVTYTELAALAGRPAAIRAAASACARNAAALFVPCHRVLRAGGAVGGFRWGADVKRWLIAHEATPASR